MKRNGKQRKIRKKLIAFKYFIIDTFVINDFCWYRSLYDKLLLKVTTNKTTLFCYPQFELGEEETSALFALSPNFYNRFLPPDL